MLRALLGTLVLAAGPMGIASTAETPWSAERPLVWEDFQGPVKDGGNVLRVAAAATSIRWRYAYQVEWSRSECRFRITSIESFAALSTGESWVKPGHRTPGVLAHEQGHFDITEIHRRKLDAETSALLGTTGSCQGQRRGRVSRFAEREIERRIDAVFDRVWAECMESQRRYDAETRHGLEARAQADWAAKIAAVLDGAAAW